MASIKPYGANSRFWRAPRPEARSPEQRRNDFGASMSLQHEPMNQAHRDHIASEGGADPSEPRERTFQTRAQLRRLAELEERRRGGWCGGDAVDHSNPFIPPAMVLSNPKRHVDGVAAQKMRRWARPTDDPAAAMGTLLGKRSGAHGNLGLTGATGQHQLWKSMSQRRVFQESEAGSECTTARRGGETSRTRASSVCPSSARSDLSFVSASSVAMTVRCAEACARCGALLGATALAPYSHDERTGVQCGGACGACGGDVSILEARRPVDVLVSRSREGGAWARRGKHRHGPPTMLYRGDAQGEWKVTRGRAGASLAENPVLQQPAQQRRPRARPSTASSHFGASRNSLGSWGNIGEERTARSDVSNASACSDVSRASSIVTLKNRESEIQAELAALSRTISAKKTMRRSQRARRAADERAAAKLAAARHMPGVQGFLAREFCDAKDAKNMVKTLHRATLEEAQNRGKLDEVLGQLSQKQKRKW